MAKAITPLSFTQLPFDAKCWLPVNDPLITKYPQRQMREKHRYVTDGNGRLLFSLKGLTFDEVPLGYLDWLVGQPWLYGNFKARLTAYISRPVIQRELDALFPDPDDDSYKPAFSVQGTYQRREPMPKEEPEPYVPKMSKSRAWGLAAELLSKWEDTTPYWADEDDIIDMPELKAACKLLPDAVVQRLRSALKTRQDRLAERLKVNAVQLEAVPYFEAYWNNRLKTTPLNTKMAIRRWRCKQSS